MLYTYNHMQAAGGSGHFVGFSFLIVCTFLTYVLLAFSPEERGKSNAIAIYGVNKSLSASPQ